MKKTKKQATQETIPQAAARKAQEIRDEHARRGLPIVGIHAVLVAKLERIAKTPQAGA